jgi:hypothetical protein
MLDLEDRCLFGSSTGKWSMIFRCENLESQVVEKGYYTQAIPPNYSSLKKPAPTGAKGSHGVVTPHGSHDCTIWKPKEPTFLPTDTCLTLDVSHSVFINQPATCANGKAALAEAFSEPDCKTSVGWLGTDAFSNEYGASLDKKCPEGKHEAYNSYAETRRWRCSRTCHHMSTLRSSLSSS